MSEEATTSGTGVHPYAIAAAVTVATSAATFQAFRRDNSGDAMMLISLAVVYGVLGAAAVWWFDRRGELRDKLAPRGGDITFGALIAVGMYLLATGVHLLLTSRGSPKEAWIIHVYIQIGDPEVSAAFYIAPLIMLVGAAEELVWRGLVLSALGDRLSSRHALIVTTLLYTLAHASTMYLLSDPIIGWNPLVVMAAMGCGLIWGLVVLASKRLMLSMVAHALFIWSVVNFPIMNM